MKSYCLTAQNLNETPPYLNTLTRMYFLDSGVLHHLEKECFGVYNDSKYFGQFKQVPELTFSEFSLCQMSEGLMLMRLFFTNNSRVRTSGQPTILERCCHQNMSQSEKINYKHQLRELLFVDYLS